MILLGPPGTGKTTTLLNIMETEMEHGVEPDRIAYVSFTRRATNEVRDRMIGMFRLTTEDFPYVRTIHSLAFYLMGLTRTEMMASAHYQEIGELLGLEFSPIRTETDDLMPLDNKYTGDQYLFLDSFSRARCMSPQDVWRMYGRHDLNWWEFERFRQTLKNYKDDRGLFDFADLLEADVEPLDIDVAIIDEAQDLSTLQWKFVSRVMRNVPRMYVAGDDDQAIYTWSGADVAGFQALGGEVQVLEQSHRVPRRIHAVAMEIASRISHRRPKMYRPTDNDGLVDYYTELDHVDLTVPGTWLLLARNNYQLRQYVAACRRQGVYYSYRGTPSASPEHLEAIRAWEKRRRGQEIDTEQEALIAQYTLHPDPATWPTEKIWHEALVRMNLEDREYYISLLRRGEDLLGAPRVNISTIHGVKGGEADHVVLLTDMSVRTFSGMQMDPDAEHRVWYVGATRARQSLHIVMPQTRYAYVL